ncbi:MAG: hypothetical protein WA890_20695, partial [Micromonospora sp.]
MTEGQRRDTARAVAEPSVFVDTYRRVLSPQARRAIAKRLSPQTRHQVKQWVAQVAGGQETPVRR